MGPGVLRPASGQPRVLLSSDPSLSRVPGSTSSAPEGGSGRGARTARRGAGAATGRGAPRAPTPRAARPARAQAPDARRPCCAPDVAALASASVPARPRRHRLRRGLRPAFGLGWTLAAAAGPHRTSLGARTP